MARSHRIGADGVVRPADVCVPYCPPRRFAPSHLCEEGIRLTDKRVILATNRNASRRPLRPHDNDASHPICLEKVAQFLLHDKALAARRVTHEDSFAIARDDSSMKHIEILACGSKKNQVTALQMRFEPWHCRLRYTFHASPLGNESGYNVQNAFPAEYRDSRH